MLAELVSAFKNVHYDFIPFSRLIVLFEVVGERISSSELLGMHQYIALRNITNN